MIIFSGCACVSNSRFVNYQVTLPDFGALVEKFLKKDTFIPAEYKEQLPLFMSAEYAEAGVRRCAVNVLRNHFLVFDVDKGTWKDLEPTLKQVAQYGYILYTSFSHEPQGQLKVRIIVKLSRSVDITEWPAFFVRALYYFGLNGIADEKCADPCHMFYQPGGDPARYSVSGEDGPGLGVDMVLGLPLPEGMKEKPLDNYEESLSEEDRGEITEGLRDYWDAKLHNLCDEIRDRPFPGELYDLKSHGVFGIARGIPHLIEEKRVREMVIAALDYRYNRNTHDPAVPAYREKAIEEVEGAIEDGKGRPWYPPKIDEIKSRPLTEMGLGERLLDRHKKDLAWEETWQRWLVWEGAFWNLEAGRALVQEHMKETVRSIPEEADAFRHDRWIAKKEFEKLNEDPNVSPEVMDLAEEKYKRLDKIIEEILKFAKQSETRNKVSAGAALAATDRDILISYTQLNRDPWVFNFLNGTLDLRTGQLREHNRKDYITRLAPHKFDPNATCPTFDRFLSECMQGNRGLVDFIWRLLGYTAVGVTTEQILVLNIGEGANGKTTFMNAIIEAFGIGIGGYAFAANSKNLLTNKGAEKHETWRMSFFGKRLVTAQEVEEGKALAESLIKELTGSDPITGRKMREDEWTYVPEYQLWVSANQLPHVRGTDEGIWRRLKVIPWNASFRGKEDRDLPQKLRQEIPGIWTRIAREAVLWREKGLPTPEAVEMATEDYRREQDPLQPFIDQWFIEGPELFVPRDIAWAAYLEYAEDSRNKVFHQRKRFYVAMRKRYPDHKLHSGVRGFLGLRIKTPQERHESSPKARLIKAQQGDPNDPGDFKLN